MRTVTLVTTIPELEAYSRTVTNIFYYFSNSALRSNKLVEIQTLLQLPSLKFANIHSVRWLSLPNAVEVLYRTCPALVVALEHEAVTNSVAKGLLNEVTQYKFIGFTHLMMDILPFIGRLSKTFQTSALDFSKIVENLRNRFVDIGMLEMLSIFKGATFAAAAASICGCD